jgi:hypothetical protein
MRRVSTDELAWRPDDLVYFRGEPFTGIAYRLATEGWTLYEREYRCGAESGRAREWYGPGRLAGECAYLDGWLHGPAREYDPDGQLLREASYELGFCLARRRWDRGGQLVEDYHLRETDPEYAQLLRRRDDWRRRRHAGDPEDEAS